MLGARFKSWMEAQLGRAKRRKSKTNRQVIVTNTTQTHIIPPPHLSSPESAYSTGYSTDGTSTGALPLPTQISASRAAPLVAPPPPPAPPTTHLYHEPSKRRPLPSPPVPPHRVVISPRVTSPPICATPSPRPRCRIRTNPWLGTTSPSVQRKPYYHTPNTPILTHHHTPGPYSLDSHVQRFISRSPQRSPHLSPHLSPCCSPYRSPYRSPYHSPRRSPRCSPHRSPRRRSPYFRSGASSDEECRRPRGRETAILSDVDMDSGDTGLDGGDEDDDDNDNSPGRRRARRRKLQQRRTPRSAGATPPRVRRRNPTPASAIRQKDPLLEADREAERKYRELIREAEKLLVSVSRAPLEPPHNPRIRELRGTEVECPRRSPERTHVTNFMRSQSPAVARRSPLAGSQPVPPPPPPRTTFVQHDRPHSEPPKRKAYVRDEVLQTLEGLRRSLEQQSALLAVQRTRLDSL